MAEAAPSETQPLLGHRRDTTASLGTRLSRTPYFPVIWLFPVVMLASICQGISAFARFGYYQDTFCPAPRRMLLLGSRFSLMVMLAGPITLRCGWFEEWVVMQGVTVRMDMYSTFALFVVSFATVGWWSSYGDRRGRRPVLFVSLLGGLLIDFIYLVAANIPAIHRDAQDTLSLGLIIQGLLGGVATYNGAVYAYAYDVSPSSLSRTVIFCGFHAVSFIGFRIGAACGWIVGPTLPHSNLSYILSVIIAATNLTYIYFILPESLPPASQEQTSEESTSAVNYVFIPFTIFLVRPAKHMILLAFTVYTYCWTLGLDVSLVTRSLIGNYMPSVPRWVLQTVPGLLRLSTLLCIIPALALAFKARYGDNHKSGVLFAKSIASNSILIATLSIIGIIVFAQYRSSSHNGFLFGIFFFLHPFTVGALPALYSLAASYSLALQRSHKSGALFGSLAIWASLAEFYSHSVFRFILEPAAFFLICAALLLVPNGPSVTVPVEDASEGERGGSA
ncbi:hypothetical protein FB45DRAFT_1053834 [Roridomyces roridus]|uniref:MFS general substrate transporter n=1 Tax=Roridomyces roridus TaxID=1738132 RepID=A0AAD7C7V9_9AGAR|nr:hypothetical protein FB45DRAFT_1053834 [Roridomyces roridus]